MTPNPLAGNPLASREDVARAALDLFSPLLPHFTPSGARVRLGGGGVLFGVERAELEGFARPLYALVPLALGGSSFGHWELVRRGIASGSDPAHPDFWGDGGTDQRMVEMAAFGLGLAFLPSELFSPLAAPVKRRFASFLSAINRHRLPDNNWHFFRVLVNLGLATVGETYDRAAHAESLDAIERHYDSDGFYHDGPLDRRDYYLPWAYHTYGLVYAASEHAEPARALRFRERARAFAQAFQYWFDRAGRAIPFGRSQTYRFAQGAFFGALAFANEEALPWSRVKGLYLRHLRYWSTLPIADRDGVISLGYGYPNPAIVEPYSSAGSPYWCMKYFLGLAAPSDHPFWTAPEESDADFETSLEPERAFPVAGAMISRHAREAVLFNAGQSERQYPSGAAKYAKFAYSSRFGFSHDASNPPVDQAVFDSMLGLREEHGPYRVREHTLASRVEGRYVASRWSPFPDVEIETVLAAGERGFHFRVHHLRTGRALVACEQGFALGRPERHADLDSRRVIEGDGRLFVENECGAGGIVTLAPRLGDGRPLERRAELLVALPNTNLIAPRTLIPRLVCRLAPGEHVLACAVFGGETLPEPLEPPSPPAELFSFRV